MSDSIDLSQLISGGALDRKTIDNLAKADRGEMRRSLEQYLPAQEVDRILARIDAMIAAEGAD